MPKILMLTPEGEEVDVDQSNFDAAISKKLEPAFEMVTPKGEQVVVRKSNYKNAIGQKLIPKSVYDAKQAPEEVGKLESAARGGLQGASMGFADEALAGIRSLVGKESYNDALESERSRNKSAQSQHSTLYGGGEIAGAIASPNPLGKAGLLGRLAGGAGQGALTGLGLSEDKSGMDALKGAGLGLAGGVLGEGISKGASKIADTILDPATMRSMEYRQAAKATDALKKDARRVENYGTEQFGKQLRDAGVVQFGDTADSIGKKAVQLAANTGKSIGSKLDSYDAAGVQVPLQKFKKDVQENIIDRLTEPGSPLEHKRIAQEISDEVSNLTKDFESTGGVINASTANKIKSKIHDIVYRNEAKTPGLRDTERREMASNLMRTIDDSIGGKLGEAEKVAFKDLKKTYGAAAIAGDIGEDVAERALANRNISPSTYMVGVGKLAQGANEPGATLSAAAWALANQVGLKYGNAALSAGFSQMAKILESNPGKLSQKAMRALSEAAKKGNSSLAATHLMLMNRDPEYKKAIESE